MTETFENFLFDNNPCPMWIYDLETMKFLDVNKAALMKYQYSKEQFLSLSILDIRPEEEKKSVIDTISLVREKEYHDSKFWTHINGKGEKFRVNIVSFSIDYKGKQARLVQIIEMEDYFREKEKVLTLVKKLEKNLDFLSKTIWDQSHMMRARVSNILALVNLFQDDIIQQNEHQVSLQKINSEAEALDEIIQTTVLRLNTYIDSEG